MIRYFKRHIGFFRCAVSEKLAYRGSLLIRMFTSSISMIVSLFLWTVLFREQAIIGGYGFREMIAYLAVVFICNATLGYTTERNISERVLDGSITSDLIKPLKFRDLCLFEAMGGAVVEFIIALVAGTLIIVLIGGVPDAVNVTSILLFAVSFLLALFLKFFISYIAGLTCFYTSNGFGVLYLRQTITDIFSGAMLPISFYPIWFQSIAGVLPFQETVYMPTQIFLGRIVGREALFALVLQAVWILILCLFSWFFFSRAVRKITIHGG